MHILTVDGSHSDILHMGGVGGYITDENKNYITHFHYALKSKVAENDFEALAVIAGLRKALDLGIKNIHVRSDDQVLLSRLALLQKNDPNLSNKNKKVIYRKGLESKILEVLTRFESAKLSIVKCKMAHHLSRLYLKNQVTEECIVEGLKQKLKDPILKSHKKITFTVEKEIVPPKESITVQKAINVTITIPKPMTKAQKKDLNKKLKKINAQEKKEGQFFSSLIKNTYIHPATESQVTASENASWVEWECGPEQQSVSITGRIGGELFKKTYVNQAMNHQTYEGRAHFMNYVLASFFKRVTDPKLAICFKGVEKQYLKQLWSAEKVDLNKTPGFQVLAKFMSDNQHCKELLFFARDYAVPVSA